MAVGILEWLGSGPDCPLWFPMNRQSKHHKARSVVAAKLGSMGFGVEDVPRAKGYDLLVNGEIRVALRVAFPGRYAHSAVLVSRMNDWQNTFSLLYHSLTRLNRDLLAQPR